MFKSISPSPRRFGMKIRFDGRGEIVELVRPIMSLSIDEDRRCAVHSTAYAAEKVGSDFGGIFSAQ
jgi:hypothetical protein